MPGILRFYLSMLVIFSHLSGSHGTEHFGYYSVRSFFILSGLMLTKALHETYQFNFFRFYSNRLLRIVPLYFIVCGLTIFVIRLFPDQAADFMPRWSFDQKGDSILQNFLLLPLAFGYLQLRYVEPAWSLAVELIMYVLLWVGMSRSEKASILCFSFGLAYHIVSYVHGDGFGARYFSIASAIMSYAVGAMIYFRFDQLKQRSWIGATAAVLWFCNTMFGYYLWGERVLDIGFYANTFLFALAAPYLLDAPVRDNLRKHDIVLGHLSYPIFLVQWLAGFAGYLILHGMEGRGVILFYLSAPVIVAMAALLTKANDWIIEPVRQRLRGRPGPIYAADFLPVILTAK